MKELNVITNKREVMVNITREIQQEIEASAVTSGFVICYVPHTTAGITINENADPDVTRDILYKLGTEIPQTDGYHHGEGNSDAHIKASLMGSSVQILIENSRLVLGRWQGIYFCEFDGPRTRSLLVKVVPVA